MSTAIAEAVKLKKGAKVKAPEVVEPELDKDKDRLVLHVGPQLKALVKQAADAHSAARAGIPVTQVDIARIAGERGIVRGRGGPTLRKLDPSVKPVVEPFKERIFVPHSPALKEDLAKVASGLSNAGVTCHAQAAGRGMLWAALKLVNGKAVLRPPL